MKRIIGSILFLGLFGQGIAQKPLIDSSVYATWPAAGAAAISNDGNYFSYLVVQGTFGLHTLVMRARTGNWKLEIPGVIILNRFSHDSRFALFMKGRDSLGIVRLGSDSIGYIPHVRSFRLAGKGKGEGLAYTVGRELTVRNLTTGSRQSFPNVSDYWFDEDGAVLAMTTETRKDSVLSQTVEVVSLPGSEPKPIWQGVRATNFLFSGDGSKLAFLTEDRPNGQSLHALWVYRVGADRAEQVADDHASGIESSLRLGRIRSFTRDGTRLFVDLRERDYPKPGPGAARVDVWNYKDVALQSFQLGLLENLPGNLYGHSPRDFAAVVSLGSKRVMRLEADDEHLDNAAVMAGRADSFVLVRHQEGDGGEANWNPATRIRFYRVSTRDGGRVLLNRMPGGRLAPSCALSPDGQFALYYDAEKRAWCSFELASGVSRNITHGVSAQWADTTKYLSDIKQGFYVEGWMNDGRTVLLRDFYDIWKADLRGTMSPVCVTNGYGRKHRITFRLGSDDYKNRSITADEQLLLTAFDNGTKDNGFYRKAVGESGDPRLLTMGPYLYCADQVSGIAFARGFAPLKAGDARVWLVQRQTTEESPNYFWTGDFQTFTPVSDVYPEKQYQWISSRLYHWKGLDGAPCQGVLYLPAEFDPHKKYPVIFNYYEKFSLELHVYHAPHASYGDIEIPWFVTHGYLVFTPDIDYRAGHPGESVVNVLVSAAKYLAGMPWVDAKRMGLQGGSFGGFETDYLVTHTHLFAAAYSRSGFGDLLSDYGAVTDLGAAYAKTWAETGQGRIDATLWERPDLFLANTSLLRADQVTTPLLMMNNKGDGVVPFSQGVEFFTALRRLGKKVWMLQYDGEGHSVVYNKANIADLNIRMVQFFDHYLKGTPAPKWMVEGIPARMKGIDSGLELEPGRIP